MIQLKTVFITLIAFIFSFPATAKSIYTIAEIDPDKTDFNAYLSYKYNQLLISFVNKTPTSFNCLPNRYIFYNFETEKLHEEEAGNLVINSGFNQYIATKIHALGAQPKTDRLKWKKEIQKLIKTLDVSAVTLEKGKLFSVENRTQCWQQPILKKMNHQQVKALPYLMANICDGFWCSDIYWSGKEKIRFWAHIDPKVFHLIELNLSSNHFKLLKKTSLFKQKEKKQDNAPRKNLVNLKKAPQSHITLRSKKGEKIELKWKKTKEGKIKVFLERDKQNSSAANHLVPVISKLIREKKVPQAIQLIQFSFWLDPKNSKVKFEQLKTLSELLLYKEFFEYLASAFSYNERTTACQKIHVNKTFQNIRKLKSFPEKFKKICF